MGAITVYTGPSMIDGRPIVVLATLGSTNVKTGPMVQTFILRSDMTPVEAYKVSADESICGDCPRRHSLGGDCYVLVHNAPQSAWRAWERAGKPDGDVQDAARRIAKDAHAHGIRFGAYGDPAAVPWQVWQSLLDGVARLSGRTPSHTGYTHQWGRAWRLGSGMDPHAAQLHRAWCRDNLMASVDSPAEAVRARSLGWRYFLAVQESARSKIPSATIECLSVRENSVETCRTCGICDGASRGSSKASVYLIEHGALSKAKARRSASLRVMS